LEKEEIPCDVAYENGHCTIILPFYKGESEGIYKIPLPYLEQVK